MWHRLVLFSLRVFAIYGRNYMVLLSAGILISARVIFDIVVSTVVSLWIIDCLITLSQQRITVQGISSKGTEYETLSRCVTSQVNIQEPLMWERFPVNHLIFLMMSRDRSEPPRFHCNCLVLNSRHHNRMWRFHSQALHLTSSCSCWHSERLHATLPWCGGMGSPASFDLFCETVSWSLKAPFMVIWPGICLLGIIYFLWVIFHHLNCAQLFIALMQHSIRHGNYPNCGSHSMCIHIFVWYWFWCSLCRHRWLTQQYVRFPYLLSKNTEW